MKYVTNNIYRGPRVDLNDLVNFDIVIDLEMGFYEMYHVITGKKLLQFPNDYNLRYYHVPLSDWSVPREEYVRQVLEIITKNRDKLIYIHCLHGVDRTGYVCAALRICLNDWSVNASIDEMYNEGFHRFPYFLWPRTLKNYRREALAREGKI